MISNVVNVSVHSRDVDPPISWSWFLSSRLFCFTPSQYRIRCDETRHCWSVHHRPVCRSLLSETIDGDCIHQFVHAATRNLSCDNSSMMTLFGDRQTSQNETCREPLDTAVQHSEKTCEHVASGVAVKFDRIFPGFLVFHSSLDPECCPCQNFPTLGLSVIRDTLCHGSRCSPTVTWFRCLRN